MFCIAKIASAFLAIRLRLRCATIHIVQCLVLACVPGLALAQALAASAPLEIPAGVLAPVAPAAAHWIRVQRLSGRITAQSLGLVINEADPYSVAVGEYYIRRRGIPLGNVLRVKLPVKARLSLAEFQALDAQIRLMMPASVQALALAWSQPYAVQCNSITSALAMGYQAEVCQHSCAASQESAYFTYAGDKPEGELGLRPSMLIAARSVESARRLIDRGIAADASLPSPFVPAYAYYFSTSDAARSVRTRWFPPAGLLRPWGVEVRRQTSDSLPPLRRALLVQTGLARVSGLSHVEWLPGAVADHLTSFGGELDTPPDQGQMSALAWIEAGATASYGTVSEPCNHWQKFPHPQLLLLSYLQGVSVLEAYWHSVAWPAQGVFVGEPLAAPFAPPF